MCFMIDWLCLLKETYLVVISLWTYGHGSDFRSLLNGNFYLSSRGSPAGMLYLKTIILFREIQLKRIFEISVTQFSELLKIIKICILFILIQYVAFQDRLMK